MNFETLLPYLVNEIKSLPITQQERLQKLVFKEKS
jgi:hypothetical protein